MHVVDEESGGCGEQDRQVPHLEERAAAGGAGQQIDEQRDAGNQRDAAAETVHVVDEIEGVRQTDDPHERQQHVERRRRHPIEPVVEEHEDRRDDDLGDQLRGRLQRQHIVDEADEEDERGRSDEHGHSRGDPKHNGAEKQRDRDGDAAEQRHRPPVPAIFARRRHEAEPQRHDTRERHQRQ